MKRIWQWVIVLPIAIGVLIGIGIAVSNQINVNKEGQKIANIFGNLEVKPAEITKFYTYGTSLNIEGKVKGIKKDNYEGARILVTDGEKTVEYKPEVSFDDYGVVFTSGENINDAIDLDGLNPGTYYINIRFKLNNSREYKYYSFSNVSSNKNIEYFTLTKEDKNNKIDIKFTEFKYNDKKHKCLSLKVEECKLPENVYDIVIDAAAGGTDKGEKYGDYNEADLMLDYAVSLKEKLEAKGYKVKLTRDESNNSTYTTTNMYDEDGRISIACKTKAKYMVSLHLNSSKDSGGIEVYAPCKSNLELATKMANTIVSYTNIAYSNYNAYKKADGVYVKNYNKQMIESTNSVERNYEPYPLTVDTPYLYTIREVGGIATNAYVDGRNATYSANAYYKSNQGIECYQIHLGSIKNNLNDLLNQKENYLSAIASCF